MSSKQKLSPAQETAQKILNLLQPMDDGCADCIALWSHPEYQRIMYHGAYEGLSDEAKSIAEDNYSKEYKSNMIHVWNAEESSKDNNNRTSSPSEESRLDYIRHALEEIVDGKTTSGNGGLGKDLEDFANAFYYMARYEEAGALHNMQYPPKDDKKSMHYGLAQLYTQTFSELRECVKEGVSRGLFTDGQPLDAPQQTQSMADKYAKPRKMVAGDIGI